MGVTAASASVMLKRLGSLGIVHHTPYRGVSLTRVGTDIALAATRDHRLLEQYLVEALEIPPDRADVEARRLEHALSPAVADRIDAALGHPTYDFQGRPIPRYRPTGRRSRALP
jgi:DtxR family Mn-dependent transcriptional regulator